MESYRLKKNLIFYNPGLSGPVFTYTAGNFMNKALLKETIEQLEDDTDQKVVWTEERRDAHRPEKIIWL